MQASFATMVYNTLSGAYRTGFGVPGVENAFEEGKECLKLYFEAYDAYQRLCDKLGVTDKDEDIEIIFLSFLEISYLMGIKMYHYGSILEQQNLP